MLPCNMLFNESCRLAAKTRPHCGGVLIIYNLYLKYIIDIKQYKNILLTAYNLCHVGYNNGNLLIMCNWRLEIYNVCLIIYNLYLARYNICLLIYNLLLKRYNNGSLNSIRYNARLAY